jgi:hypothetical protein
MEIGGGAGRLDPKSIACGKRPRQVIALGDQQRLIDSKDVPRPLAGGEGPASPVVKDQGRGGGAKLKGKIPHRGGLVPASRRSAQEDPPNRAPAEQVYGGTNPVGKDGRRGAVAPKPGSEDDGHRACGSLGYREHRRSVAPGDGPARQAQEQGSQKQQEGGAGGKRDHPVNHHDILPELLT